MGESPRSPALSLDALARVLRTWIPDPFVIAIGLTGVALLVALVTGVLLGDLAPQSLVEAWVGGWVPLGAPPGAKPMGGLWSLLAFAMQMCLILVTGYAAASTRPMRRAIAALARIPSGTRSAAVLIVLVACALALLNWGLGLVVGALLAREMGMALEERGVAVHYPVLAASGYVGLAVWHGGFSGSAPLKVTSRANLDEVLGSVLSDRVPVMTLFDTVLSPRNLIVTGLAVGVLAVGVMLLVPRDPARFVRPPARGEDRDAAPEPAPGIAGWLENGPAVSLALAALAVAWIVPWAWGGGLSSLNPDSMNLLMLAAGLVLAGSPAAYMRLAARGARACAGIIVQFPLYGGILGLLAAAGVVELVADVLPASPGGLSLTTFLSAGAVNLFVPSGGGQWTIQGPMVMQAAAEHGVDPGRVVLALAWGDQWTNLFQPFWALPLLGITGARAGDLLGSTFILGLGVGVVYAVGAWAF